MNTEASTEKLIPGGILFALMTQRKELLGMTMGISASRRQRVR